jgi:hypothetical protein
MVKVIGRGQWSEAAKVMTKIVDQELVRGRGE